MIGKETVTIIDSINNITRKQDKNGSEYLVIKTDNSHIIFVFGRMINPKNWKDLQIDQSYQFSLQINPEKTYVATDFSKVITFEFP